MTEYIDTLKERFNTLNKAVKLSGHLYAKSLITLYDMTYELLLAHYAKTISSPAKLNQYVSVAAAYISGGIDKAEFNNYLKELAPLTKVLDETIKDTEEKDFDYI